MQVKFYNPLTAEHKVKIARMEKIIQEQTWHIVEERRLLEEKQQQVDDLSSIVPFEYAATPDRAMMRRN